MSVLSDKIALVTGGSRGVGKGIAIELGAAGATVYVTGRTRKNRSANGVSGSIDETAEAVIKAGGDGIAIECDHTNDFQVEKAISKIKHQSGKIDILVNNVWGGYEFYDMEDFTKPFYEQPLIYWERMFMSGVRAHYVTTRFVAPIMIKQQSGLIVNVSAGDRGLYLGNLLYDVAKNAVDRMAFGFAEELKKHNITALALYPGLTRTERVMQFYEGEPEITESPQYSGRAVVALATDNNIAKKSGKAFKTGDLARECNFKDIDGKQPEPFEIG